MGTDHPKILTDGEGPKRLVTLSDFLIDKYEVSNDEYRKFVDSTGYRTESEFFGWSFVFESAVPSHLKAKITQAVLGAEWWLPVNGSYWREPEGPGIVHNLDPHLISVLFQHRPADISCSLYHAPYIMVFLSYHYPSFYFNPNPTPTHALPLPRINQRYRCLSSPPLPRDPSCRANILERRGGVLSVARWGSATHGG